MTLAEFIAATADMPRNTEIVVGGFTVHGAQAVIGRLSQKASYFGVREFKPMPDKPRDTVLVFTRDSERSDGSIVGVPI